MMLTPSQAARELDLTPAAVRAAAGSPAFQEIRHAALDQPSSTAA